MTYIHFSLRFCIHLSGMRVVYILFLIFPCICFELNILSTNIINNNNNNNNRHPSFVAHSCSEQMIKQTVHTVVITIRFCFFLIWFVILSDLNCCKRDGMLLLWFVRLVSWKYCFIYIHQHYFDSKHLCVWFASFVLLLRFWILVNSMNPLVFFSFASIERWHSLS